MEYMVRPNFLRPFFSGAFRCRILHGNMLQICCRFTFQSWAHRITHWSGASWAVCSSCPIFSSTKKGETMRNSKSCRILLWFVTCGVHTSSFIRRLTQGWSIPKPNRNRVAAGGTCTENEISIGWVQSWQPDWSLVLVLFVNGLRDSLLTIGGRLIYSPRYWLLVGQLVYGTKLVCRSSSFLQQIQSQVEY